MVKREIDAKGEGVRRRKEERGKKRLTAFPVANFFSVPTMAPLRWAWFRAPFPRTTVSR